MKEVERKDLTEIPGGVRTPYPPEGDVKPGNPMFPGAPDYPRNPQTPVEPVFE